MQTFSVLNVKCNNCANTLKKSLKEEFGKVDVNLEVEPREISLDVKNSDIKRLTVLLKSLGYPLATKKMNIIEGSSAKVKSFISCAKGSF